MKHFNPTPSLTNYRVKRCNVLQLRRSSWVNGSAVDEFIRLLHMRQRASEAASSFGLQCLYLDTVWSAYVHPATDFATASTPDHAMTVEKILAPSALVNHTGCNRCCLDQDRIISVFNVNRNHWVCIELNMTDCSIVVYRLVHVVSVVTYMFICARE